MLTLLTLKWIILICMFFVTFIFGFIPYKLIGSSGNSQRIKKAISLLSCYSGGVFIAACLLDLFPDVRESIDNVLNEIEKAYHTTIDYPVAEFVIVIGFFLILIIEQMVLEFRGDPSSPHVDSEQTEVVNQDADESSPLLGGAQRSVSRESTSSRPSSPMRTPSIVSLGRDHDHDHDHIYAFEHSSLRSILLLIALSFHSLFEGLAIGLQTDETQMFSIFSAVIIHKAIMAFSLGLTIAQSPLTLKAFMVSNLTFSLASPIGMALGIALMDMQQSLTRDIANGILQGVSGGTFLYITFFEVLPHELNKPDNRMLKLLFVILGYTSICSLLFITH